MSNKTITSDPARLSRYVVPATIMLSFVSFWRAAAIVLSDLGSTAYYIGGIAEKAIGKAAPWFILGIMLFSYAVRAVYVESCSMFVRGGVYRVVHEAMGGTAAKLSVSALMFDYVLTGPISAVSAGLYLVGWCVLTIATKGYQPVPAPTLANLKFSDDALGWLKGTVAPTFTVIAILIGLGHSL